MIKKSIYKYFSARFGSNNVYFANSANNSAYKPFQYDFGQFEYQFNNMENFFNGKDILGASGHLAQGGGI